MRSPLRDGDQDALRTFLSGAGCTVEDLVDALDNLEADLFDKDPTVWLPAMLPAYFPFPFAGHHVEVLEWAWSINLGKRRRPEVDVWPRGGAKSTLAEAVNVMLGARGQRKYGLYVCRTQEQANDHVGNVASMLESPQLAAKYPEMVKRAVGMYGTSKGWRRNRLRTRSGFTLDAVGLDTASRGIKIEEQRPDIITVDDIDDPFDNPATVRKMIETLSRSLIQAGSLDVIVWVIQNLVHRDGVVAQIVDGRAQLLADRHVSGPIPAIVGDYVIEYTGDTEAFEDGGRPWRLVGGEPSWVGQDREACEAKLAQVGPAAWESEAQHKPQLLVGGMFEDVLPDVAHCLRDQVPPLVRVAVCVDPAVTDSDGSDAHGVQCDGIDAKGVIYRMRSWEQRAAPRAAIEKAIEWAYEEGALEVGVEMNLGSDLSGRSIEESWGVVFADALKAVLERHPEWTKRPKMRIKKLRATTSLGSKAARGSVMHTDYERPGRIVHVIGDHEILEAALGRAFVVKPFDLADAAFYSWNTLRRPAAMVGTSAGASQARRRR